MREVQVSVEEDAFDSDEDISPSEVSTTTITCVQQTCKEEDLATIKNVKTQQKESQSLTKKYTPP